MSLLPQQIVAELRLNLRFAHRRVSSYTPDPRAEAAYGLLVSGDDDATRASFRRVTGGDAEHRAWRSFHARLHAFAGRLFPTLTEPLRTRGDLRAIATDDPAILLCGAGARRGGGISAIPGRNAAMAALAGC